MHSLRILMPLALLSLLACQPKGTNAPAPASSADAAPAVAVVNGEPIGKDLFEFYAKGVSGKPSSELTEEQRSRVLDNLIRGMLVAQQAEKDGLLKNDKDTASLVELSRINVLEQAMSDRYLKDKKPTEQEVRAEYETQVAALPRVEYHARHILVATEAFAEKLIAQLEKGANFADLAKRESMDSKEQGGDLSWVTPERMVKPFAEALVALKPGEFTHTPVKTQFGWHIIKLEATRDAAAPPFEQVRQRLEQMVQAKKFKTYTDELLRNAKVEKKLGGPAAASGDKPQPPAG